MLIMGQRLFKWTENQLTLTAEDSLFLARFYQLLQEFEATGGPEK